MTTPADRSGRRLCGLLAAGVAALATLPGRAAAQDPIRIVATLPTYASIAREITGDLAEISSIARGDEDPHFVNPRPSFVADLRRADLFITTGLDLELWVPSLLDRANNPRVVDGAPGNVVAHAGVKLLDVPTSVSRSGGDVHVFGNPHLLSDPINAILVGRNILAGLRRVAPARSATWEANEKAFEEKLIRRLFGDRLTDMLGAETLFELARTDRFWSFAREQSFQGRPLTDYLGGWMADAAPYRGKQMACYHKNWAYFGHRFQVACGIYIEAKPGIPPTPGHVGEVVRYMKANHVPALIAANYYPASRVRQVAERTGAAAVIVPEHTAGEPGIETYMDLVDSWVERLAKAYAPK